MIKVAGIQLDLVPILSKYAQDSVERSVLQAMSASSALYEFKNKAELQFELELRAAIVDAATALNKSRMQFATFHDARCNTLFWEKTGNGGFLLKSTVKPSDAIEDIFKNGSKYATECATAMMIVYYKALLTIYGEERFNQTFKSIYLMDWSIKEPLLSRVGTPRKADDVLLGDRAYFMNKDVDPSVPWWRGENVIVLPNNLYYGHGVGITSGEQILKHLNANRKPGSKTEAYLMNEVARPDFKNLYEAYIKDIQPPKLRTELQPVQAAQASAQPVVQPTVQPTTQANAQPTVQSSVQPPVEETAPPSQSNEPLVWRLPLPL